MSTFLSLGQGLTKKEKFRLVKTERKCRQQFKYNSNEGIFFFDRVENIVGKQENVGYHVFNRAARDCVENLTVTLNHCQTTKF